MKINISISWLNYPDVIRSVSALHNDPGLVPEQLTATLVNPQSSARLYIDAAETLQTAVVYQSDTPVSMHSIDVLAYCDNSAAERVVKEGKLATFNAKKNWEIVMKPLAQYL